METTIAIALITTIPSIILAIATLISVVRSNVKLDKLEGTVNGKLTEMLKVVTSASEVKGKLDGLLEAGKTSIIQDRRKDPDVNSKEQ